MLSKSTGSRGPLRGAMDAGRAEPRAGGARGPVMHDVDSSVIEAMGYDSRRRELTLRFRRNRGTYCYAKASPALWHALLEAPSKGTFLNQVLKPLQLPYSRVPGRGTTRAG